MTMTLRQRVSGGFATISGLLIMSGVLLGGCSSESSTAAPVPPGPAESAVGLVPADAPLSAASLDPSVTIPALDQPGADLPALESGGQPPQFVAVSFDGGVEMRSGVMAHYLDLAEQVKGRFSFYVSGTYLLPETRSDAYRPPGKQRGTSDIGFADPTMVGTRLDSLTRAWSLGMEIGSHFNGHFCGASGVNTWTSADWVSEIDQWNDFVDNWRLYNPDLQDHPPLPFSSQVAKGGRTPCLEGDPQAIRSAYRQAGYTYDASQVGDLQWPRRIGGLWEIPLQRIKVPGQSTLIASMDFNFLVNQNGGETEAAPEVCQQIETDTYEAYRSALDAVMSSNRAPLILGNHMNDWVCGAYTNALTRFIQDTARDHPDVRFISMLDLVNWIEAQDPALMQPWLDRPTAVQ